MLFYVLRYFLNLRYCASFTIAFTMAVIPRLLFCVLVIPIIDLEVSECYIHYVQLI